MIALEYCSATSERLPLPAPPNVKNPSGVWGQTAPTRVWAAPTVLRLGLILSPESGRGAATSRTRRVPPRIECPALSVLRQRGEPGAFRVRVWERVVLRATARTQARAFCGTATSCREVRRRVAQRNGGGISRC